MSISFFLLTKSCLKNETVCFIKTSYPSRYGDPPKGDQDLDAWTPAEKNRLNISSTSRIYVHLTVHILLLMYKSLQNISASAYLSSVTLVTFFWIEKKCCCQRFIDLLHSKADWTRLNQTHNDKNKTQWKMLHFWT